MNKYGFEIKLNDEKICRAGFLDADYYVTTCILTAVMREKDEKPDVYLSAGGLNSTSHDHVDWVNKPLVKGDKISIEIITEDFDPPTSIRMRDTEEYILKRKLEYYQKLKEELKDHLKE